jgi:electron transfer flavoprotein alpha subunit
MKTLILVETASGHYLPNTLSTLGAAIAIGCPITVLIVSHNGKEIASSIHKMNLIEDIIYVESSLSDSKSPAYVASVMGSLQDEFTYFLGPSSTFGKDSMPRLAALLEVAMVSDVVAIEGKKRFSHPIYAGNAIETVDVLDEKIVMTVRSTAFSYTYTEHAIAAPIRYLSHVSQLNSALYQSTQITESSRPELTTASIVVSGGRGLQSKAQFSLIEELADVLGAAVGASRAAVDAGFIANDHQVGQTGKIVAPSLYFAIGISGAVQHLAGMKESKVIVAINKDEDAPIFQIATYGIVGDLFKIVPELIESIKK